jgi:hypothetical protein
LPDSGAHPIGERSNRRRARKGTILAPGRCVRSHLPHPSFQLAKLLQLSDLVADLATGPA